MSQAINLNDVLCGKSSPPACDTTLGVKVLESKDGYAKGIWTIEEPLLNGNGVIMGGFVAAAADIMMAYAITPLLAEDQTFASINLQTTFHRPTFTGEVEVEAKVEKFGRTVSYVTADLNQNGKLVASVTSSIMIMSKK
ncbi:PaaI family thioesterase [Bacillus sp. B190/17]|uniref:PaaI family thioesterase n=1 Tax=Bacillus lumedeiriae TaxID=3058829 RepID=A0ABW8ICR0_9BACI